MECHFSAAMRRFIPIPELLALQILYVDMVTLYKGVSLAVYAHCILCYVGRTE